MSIQANQGGGVTIFSAGGTGGGGGGTPGGSSGQLQYNASGSFAGMSGTSWNDTTRSLTLTGATVTTSAPLFDVTQTWNAGATTFTAIKMNVTDTASASGSLLLDLQVGGSSKFNVSKTGGVTSLGSSVFANSSNIVEFCGSSGNSIGAFTVSGYTGTVDGLVLRSAAVVAFGTGTNPLSTVDLILGRNAAASLRLGNADAAAPVAQTLGVQSVVAGTTNTAGTNFTIKGSAGTGTGAGGSIIFQVAPAGSSGTSQNSFSTALTIASDRSVTFNAANTSFGAGTTSNFLRVTQTLPFMEMTLGEIHLSANTMLGWGSLSNSLNGSIDTVLRRDAANTLALRNGTSAQRLNLYGTYTDASNFERFSVYYSSGDAYYLAFDKLGTGVNRNLKILTGADLYLQIGGGSYYWYYTASGGHFLAGADKTYDIGASGNSPRDVYVGRNLIPTATFATNQTTGFINIPGAAGAPSGVPSNTTGFPLYYDSTNNKIYVYNGSWRSTAALT